MALKAQQSETEGVSTEKWNRSIHLNLMRTSDGFRTLNIALYTSHDPHLRSCRQCCAQLFITRQIILARAMKQCSIVSAASFPMICSV